MGSHCCPLDIFNLPLAALWTAVLGEWDKQEDPNAALRLPVEKIVIHKGFNNYNNDIALLKLSEVPASKAGKATIKPICLTEGGDDPGRMCVATGWGRASKPSNRGVGPSMVLRQISLPIHKLALCKEKYGPALELNRGHLCAGRLDGSTGACVGDSGGPLQCSAEAGKWYLVGITSFGSGCARPGYPDVYTRVAHFLPWINETIDSSDDYYLYSEGSDGNSTLQYDIN